MLISVQNFKDYIKYDKTTYDDEIEVIINSVELFIAQYCNNVIGYKEVIEYFDGNEIKNNTIFLSNRLNLSGLKIEKFNTSNYTWEEVVDVYGSNYYFYENEGRILVRSVEGGYRNYKITYTAGYDTSVYSNNLPSDLRLAILKLVGNFWNKRRSDGLVSESLDGASINFKSDMDLEVKSILDKYKNIIL
jgi:hypothetical protein